jgi:hypothetical protein
MQAHVRHNLCCGDEAHYQYLLKWMAWSVQNPDKPAGVAVILIGKEGTGKSILGRWLRKMFGQHGKLFTNQKHLTGDFNAELGNTVFLFADEAFNAKDKKANSILKALITEDTFTLEKKGVDAIMARNHLHIMMASNERHVIPAGLQARRYLVLEVSDAKIQDPEYFTPLWDGLENGGTEAMLFDLLHMDLGSWNPMHGVPKTTALVGQQADNLPTIHRHVLSMLQSAQAHGAIQTKSPATPGWVFISTARFMEAFELKKGCEQIVAKYLKHCCAEGPKQAKPIRETNNTTGKQERGLWLPPLSEARRYFNVYTGVSFPYSTDGVDWETEFDVESEGAEFDWEAAE